MKKKKRYLKRKKFISIFLVRLVMFSAVLGVLGTGIMYYKEREYRDQIEDYVIGREEFVRHILMTDYKKLSDIYSHDELKKMFAIASKAVITGTALYADGIVEAALSLYDSESMELISDTGETFSFMTVDDLSESWGDNRQKGKIRAEYYYGADTPGDELLSFYKKYGYRLDIRICPVDVYIDGDRFYFGRIEARDNSNIIADSIDMTPDDVSGMKRIDIKAMSEKHIHYHPGVFPAGSDNMLALNRAAFSENSGDERIIDETHIKEQKKLSYVKTVYTTISLSDDAECILIYSYRYDWMNAFGKKVLYGALLLLLLSVVLAYLTAKYSYVYLKARYDIEDYQRSLTNMLAHDLKTPLMALTGYAEMLKEQVHPEKREYYTECIVKNVEDMNNMVNQILEFSRLDSYVRELPDMTNNVEIDILFSEIEEKYADLLSKKKMSILTDGKAQVKGNEKLLKIAFDNLIQNAIIHGEMSGEIKVLLSPGKVIFENRYDGKLDGKDVSKLLREFEKGDSAGRSKTRGHGLGLAIADRILTLHGFELDIKAESGVFRAEVRITE